MNIDRFTTIARQAVVTAQSLAVELSQTQFGPLHLLQALLQDDRGIAAAIIERAGHRPAALAEIVTAELKGLPTVSASDPKPPPATGPLMQVISGAEQLAGSMGDRYVAVEHLLLALAETPSPAKTAMSAVGLDAPLIRSAVEQVRAASGVESIDDPEA